MSTPYAAFAAYSQIRALAKLLADPEYGIMRVKIDHMHLVPEAPIIEIYCRSYEAFTEIAGDEPVSTEYTPADAECVTTSAWIGDVRIKTYVWPRDPAFPALKEAARRQTVDTLRARASKIKAGVSA